MGRPGLEIYFFGAINGSAADIVPWYRPMIQHAGKFGTVLSADIFFRPEIVEGNEHGCSDQEIFERDTSFIDRAQVLIGDVTRVSTGVGYELGYADSRGKPILCLHRQGVHPLTAMVAGNRRLTIGHYTTLPGAYGHITKFFNNLRTRH